MQGITNAYNGFSDEVLTQKQFLNLFDTLWDKSLRDLPRYPKVIGGIFAYWRDSKGLEHHVEHINEIIDAYKKKLTYDIYINGGINKSPKISLIYTPAHKEIYVEIRAKSLEESNKKLEIVKKLFSMQEAPIIFISYATNELALADFVKTILVRYMDTKAEIFIASRDIPPGENPLKIMMETKLKKAQAIIPICSHLAKESSWVWWESASVWARNYKIYPLCTNISLGDFGPPLNLVAQGRKYFDKKELLETI